MDYSSLVTSAFEARKNAYVPYSKFAVGAALLTADGRIYLGCNIENVTLTPTVCAERTAFFKAISEDVREFAAIAVVGGLVDLGERQVDFCTPCGVCRQVMVEFCGPDFKIVTARSRDDWREYTLDQLLPEASKPKF
ncbi:MAG TPA: cytidine deaminase [Oscillospiraceae bacterium]|nr:cytidine deaminase [Oscillospiraceae bacterium]HPF55964.1 cytidine deaminase [Clostridiales bacterium]HPK35200.1 cytidine deaminase [Oscillospiraceae bacterium]HPR75003.1 cytidine deaminase [Oscillospiraceae bacterium]